jgi:ABC-type polysaccharide/polyol phosphate export permease
MPLAILFWMIMILWAIFGFWWHYAPEQPWGRVGHSFLTFVLLGILGWQVFGPAVK